MAQNDVQNKPLASSILVSELNPKKSRKQKSASQETSQTYANHPQLETLADEIADYYNLDSTWTRQTLAKARFLPRIIPLMIPASVNNPNQKPVKNWSRYRSRFIDATRINAGLKFWQENEEALAKAQAVYGVPAHIVVGIIGVETIYGQNTGSIRVLDALTTLTLDFPKEHPRWQERQAYFRSELGEFLNLSAQNKIDPLSIKGSYAGAMGLPQFMPSSWRKYAVDFDGDGKIDLFNSSTDAIGSVARYFQGYGWTPDLPTHFAVKIPNQHNSNTSLNQNQNNSLYIKINHPDESIINQTNDQNQNNQNTIQNTVDLKALLEPDIKPSFSAQEMTRLGAVLDKNALEYQGLLALIDFPNAFNRSPETMYIAGTNNFYVVTRYNWSSFYAMSVIELGQNIANARAFRQSQSNSSLINKY